MDIPEHYYRISIKALILGEEEKFLLFLEPNGTWDLPGGGLMHEEAVEECLKRELKEEAGLEVLTVATQPSYFTVGTSSRMSPKANIIYRVTVNNLNFTKSGECVDLRFFSKEEALRENLYESARMFVEQL